MRAIKFRGKNNHGNWIYGGLVYSLEDGIQPAIYFPVGNAKVKTMDWAYVDQDSVGQFTGLLDKNGKEIYEGDIVSLDDVNHDLIPFVPKLGIISWIDNGYVYQYPYDNKDGKHIYTTLCHLSLEVIGNIHDNPNLITN